MLTDSIEMHPGPPSEWVLIHFYGGPRDGEKQEQSVRASALKGFISLAGGRYSLQGFRHSTQSADDFLKQFVLDCAIYEWVPS